MNRSKCGSVLTDHFAVIAMSCNKLVAYFTKRVVVILVPQWATDDREICAVSVCSLPLGDGFWGFFLGLF